MISMLVQIDLTWIFRDNQQGLKKMSPEVQNPSRGGLRCAHNDWE